MANTRLSPAASILRNSRLFSIPPPLSRPATLASGTATQPYPTHAAIETPASSWERGDWGFKRSLPLKSTKGTGTTAIRVQNGIDSSEHITDFESAADHVVTLKKWQELNLPIRLKPRREHNEVASAFESDVDNIGPTTSDHRRWRYNGPWLAGQTGMEFDTLLNRVKRQKVEFQEFVRARLDAETRISRRQAAIDAGRDISDNDTRSVTNEEFERHMHFLRANPPDFGPLIAEFLDLPEGPNDRYVQTAASNAFAYGRTTRATDTYLASGPPSTHPSAGISYHRSGAHLFNHPRFGPQLLKPPVVGRVLRPNIKRKPGTIGVSGFVVGGGIPSSMLAASQRQWVPVPGGQKLVARPKTASVDSKGKLRLTLESERFIVLGTSDPAKEAKIQKTPPSNEMQGKQMPPLDDTGATAGRSRGVKPYIQHLGDLMRQHGDREHI